MMILSLTHSASVYAAKTVTKLWEVKPRQITVEGMAPAIRKIKGLMAERVEARAAEPAWSNRVSK